MIYYVEDDDSIRELVAYTLTQMGMPTQGFACAEDFWQGMKQVQPSLILLDVMLPGEDGLHILRTLQEDEATADIPVMMITAKGTEFDKVQGLDLGADDYIVKPFGMMEMVSRVRAVLRRSQPRQTAKCLKSGGLTVSLEERTVMADGHRVQLTYKEFELLHLFLAHPGMVYTREQLFSQVWQADYLGDSRTLDAHISTLRQKLEPYGRRIETVRNVGYRWEAGDDKQDF